MESLPLGAPRSKLLPLGLLSLGPSKLLLLSLCTGALSLGRPLEKVLFPKSSLAVVLFRQVIISLPVSSSTSLPSGAFAIVTMLATSISFLAIRSPPLSPSTKAVTFLFLLNSIMLSGTLAPSIAIAFFIPCFKRFRTSALPSTITISSSFSTSGPHGSFSGPKDLRVPFLTPVLTASVISSVSGITMFSCASSSFALS